MPWCWLTSSSSSLFNSSFFSASNFLQTSLPLLTLIAHQQLFNGLLCLLLHLSSNFPTSFSPNFSHSIKDHIDKNCLPKKIKPLHSIPPISSWVFTFRLLPPPVKYSAAYQDRSGHKLSSTCFILFPSPTLQYPISKVTLAWNSHRSTNCSDCCLNTTINSTFQQGLNLCQQDLPKCRTFHIPV